MAATGCQDGKPRGIEQRKKEKKVEAPKVEEQPYDKGVVKNARVNLSTEFGDIEIKLYDETPQHRDNFLKLAKDGYYNDLLFHRVIKDFMVQGGDPNSRGASADTRLGSGGPGYTVPAEFNPKFIHKKGALSAARTGAGNPEKRSSGSQFYLVQGKKATDKELDSQEKNIASQVSPGFKYTEEQREIYKTQGGTPFLDMNYTVYGEVTKGLDVIDKIAAVKTAPGDRPLEDVKMTVTVIK